METAGLDRLGLGTAQFGLDYGIANSAGKTPVDEVRRILAEAGGAGIRLVDTAALYGESEEALGRALPASHAFRVVTKTPKFPGGFGAAEARTLEDTLAASLRKLGLPRAYALLAHQADDLLGRDGDRFMEALLELKARGLVEKVGASVYTPSQVDALLGRHRIDAIQVPFNLLDQRLVRGGQLRALRRSGVEIHARSIFLQGVILMDLSALPAFLQPVRPVLARFRAEAAARGLDPLQAALAFALGREEISHSLVGVCDLAQLKEILAAAGTALAAIGRVDGPGAGGAGLPDWAEFHCDEERCVNPALWGKTA